MCRRSSTAPALIDCLALLATTVVMALLFSSPARSQMCHRAGTTLEIAGLSCLPQRCSNIRQSITLLGDKLLLSFGNNMWGQSGETGQGHVYYLGRTVDPSNDPLNATWRPLPNEAATLFAEVKGDKLSLVERRTQFRASRQIDSDYWLKIGVRFVGCTSCEVYQYEFGGHAKGLPATSTWRPYYCKVTN
jgi:hypothetical protein